MPRRNHISQKEINEYVAYDRMRRRVWQWHKMFRTYIVRLARKQEHRKNKWAK